ncbi:hypothetical protein [Methylocystis sp.]|uniref:hypothetical protein n=1 Tax=Methylocystis sp. TaxID=1911079 RepID=UPI0025E1B2DE|nr:hypothetical protein [Methylocystis sp.]
MPPAAAGAIVLCAGPVVLAVVWELAKAWIADDLKVVGESEAEPDFKVEKPPWLPSAQGVENL